MCENGIVAIGGYEVADNIGMGGLRVARGRVMCEFMVECAGDKGSKIDVRFPDDAECRNDASNHVEPRDEHPVGFVSESASSEYEANTYMCTPTRVREIISARGLG